MRLCGSRSAVKRRSTMNFGALLDFETRMNLLREAAACARLADAPPSWWAHSERDDLARSMPELSRQLLRSERNLRHSLAVAARTGRRESYSCLPLSAPAGAPSTRHHAP